MDVKTNEKSCFMKILYNINIKHLITGINKSIVKIMWFCTFENKIKINFAYSLHTIYM